MNRDPIYGINHKASTPIEWFMGIQEWVRRSNKKKTRASRYIPVPVAVGSPPWTRKPLMMRWKLVRS